MDYNISMTLGGKTTSVVAGSCRESASLSIKDRIIQFSGANTYSKPAEPTCNCPGCMSRYSDALREYEENKERFAEQPHPFTVPTDLTLVTQCVGVDRSYSIESYPFSAMRKIFPDLMLSIDNDREESFNRLRIVDLTLRYADRPPTHILWAWWWAYTFLRGGSTLGATPKNVDEYNLLGTSYRTAWKQLNDGWQPDLQDFFQNGAMGISMYTNLRPFRRSANAEL